KLDGVVWCDDFGRRSGDTDNLPIIFTDFIHHPEAAIEVYKPLVIWRGFSFSKVLQVGRTVRREFLRASRPTGFFISWGQDMAEAINHREDPKFTFRSI